MTAAVGLMRVARLFVFLGIDLALSCPLPTEQTVRVKNEKKVRGVMVHAYVYVCIARGSPRAGTDAPRRTYRMIQHRRGLGTRMLYLPAYLTLVVLSGIYTSGSFLRLVSIPAPRPISEENLCLVGGRLCDFRSYCCRLGFVSTHTGVYLPIQEFKYAASCRGRWFWWRPGEAPKDPLHFVPLSASMYMAV